MGTYDGHNGTVWSVDVDCELSFFSLASKRREGGVWTGELTAWYLGTMITSYLDIPRVRVSRQHDEALVGQDGRMLDDLGV